MGLLALTGLRDVDGLRRDVRAGECDSGRTAVGSAVGTECYSDRPGAAAAGGRDGTPRLIAGGCPRDVRLYIDCPRRSRRRGRDVCRIKIQVVVSGCGTADVAELLPALATGILVGSATGDAQVDIVVGVLHKRVLVDVLRSSYQRRDARHHTVLKDTPPHGRHRSRDGDGAQTGTVIESEAAEIRECRRQCDDGQFGTERKGVVAQMIDAARQCHRKQSDTAIEAADADADDARRDVDALQRQTVSEGVVVEFCYRVGDSEFLRLRTAVEGCTAHLRHNIRRSPVRY